MRVATDGQEPDNRKRGWTHEAEARYMEGIAMLVLHRKAGQKIRVGDSITITVVECGPEFTRLGIDAPTDVAIVRDDAKVTTPPASRAPAVDPNGERI